MRKGRRKRTNGKIWINKSFKLEGCIKLEEKERECEKKKHRNRDKKTKLEVARREKDEK